MKIKPVLISIIFHLLILLIALYVSFDTPPEQFTLGFGNVEFSTISKKNSNELKNARVKTKKIEEKTIGEGEALLKENLDENVLPVNPENTVNYNNGKFAIDFKGERSRAIYSYTLPVYPNGVEKEADIVMKITIEPDGTISNIFPLIKADSRLEIAAIEALRNWRFEPLPEEMPQVIQEAVVVFPYRLQ
jgi:TonB family protein